MTNNRSGRTGITIAAGLAIVFGLLTIVSGGRALFGSAEAQTAVGDAVPFVLRFNFAAGFVYLAAGIAMLMRLRAALWLSGLIAAATAMVFAGFGLHVYHGGAFEIRTVGAMLLRTAFWVAMFVVLIRAERNLQPR